MQCFPTATEDLSFLAIFPVANRVWLKGRFVLTSAFVGDKDSAKLVSTQTSLACVCKEAERDPITERQRLTSTPITAGMFDIDSVY